MLDAVLSLLLVLFAWMLWWGYYALEAALNGAIPDKGKLFFFPFRELLWEYKLNLPGARIRFMKELTKDASPNNRLLCGWMFVSHKEIVEKALYAKAARSMLPGRLHFLIRCTWLLLPPILFIKRFF